MTRLIDARDTGGMIAVYDDTDTLVAYAVPANAGNHWAVYRLVVVEGVASWTLPKVWADEQAALVDLQGVLAWAVSA